MALTMETLRRVKRRERGNKECMASHNGQAMLDGEGGKERSLLWECSSRQETAPVLNGPDAKTLGHGLVLMKLC